MDALACSIDTLHIYLPLSLCIKYLNSRKLEKLLVELLLLLKIGRLIMVLLLLFIDVPPGPVQLTLIALGFTPLTVLTVQWII